MPRPSRRRALILGRDKPMAEAAMDPYREEFDFVYLSAFSDADMQEPTEQLLADVAREMARNPFSAVLATSESNMICAGLLRSQYGWPGLDYEQSMRGTNKWRMRQGLRGVVPAPDAWLSGEFLTTDEPLPDEVVIKPVASSSSRGLRRLSRAAARDWLASDPGVWLVEEALAPDRELHCDGIISDGELRWYEVSEYDCPVLASTGVRSSVIIQRSDPLRPQLRAASEAIIASLGHANGVFHAEFLVSGETVSFGEIGLRPIGAKVAMYLKEVTGADLWGAFVASQLGRPTAEYAKHTQPAPELTGTVMARPSDAGDSPVPAAAAARLSGVTHVEDGTLKRGDRPANVNDFEYLAYFTGLSRQRVEALRAEVAGAGSA